MKEKFKNYMNRLENDVKNEKFTSDILGRFIVMWTLITRVPVPKTWWPKEIIPGHKALTVAPVVGTIMALASGIVMYGLRILGVPSLPAAWGAIAFYAASGWTIHLDGWGDLWDGIGSGKSSEELRSVMKDSRMGSFGAIGLLIAFGLWTSLASEISLEHILSALILAGSISRFSICTAAYFGTYPWNHGLAKGWVGNFTGYDWFRAFVATLLVMPLAPINWLIAMVITFFVAKSVAKFMNNKLGGVNGDVLGSVQVLCEIITLAVFFI